MKKAALTSVKKIIIIALHRRGDKSRIRLKTKLKPPSPALRRCKTLFPNKRQRGRCNCVGEKRARKAIRARSFPVNSLSFARSLLFRGVFFSRVLPWIHLGFWQPLCTCSLNWPIHGEIWFFFFFFSRQDTREKWERERGVSVSKVCVGTFTHESSESGSPRLSKYGPGLRLILGYCLLNQLRARPPLDSRKS